METIWRWSFVSYLLRPVSQFNDFLLFLRRATSLELPMAMRFRHLERTSKEAVGVYRSALHYISKIIKNPMHFLHY